MRFGSAIVMLAAGALFSVGCGTQFGGSSASSTKGGLAVIDLDVVGKSIGRTQEMNDALNVRKSALDQALQRGKADMQRQIADKKDEFGESATDEQKQQLIQMERNASSQLVQAARKAQAQLEEERQRMIAQFRAEVRPVAQQVASERGLGVVIPKNEGFLLSVDPGVDITADVVKAYGSKKPTAPTAAKTQAKPIPEATAAEPKETATN